MRRHQPHSRLAVNLRRLRGRFGIAAPRMAVRSQLPWHWRAASLIVVIAASLALAGWIYDAGRKIAGIDPRDHETALTLLRDRVAELEAVSHELQTAANSSEAKLQIEQSAQESLRRQVLILETENARLKEDLAIFENMSQGEEAEGTLTISRLRIDPALATGVYEYRMLVSQQTSKKPNEFKGQLQLVLTVQQAGKNVMITLPKAGDSGANRFQVSFRRFQRLEGTFRLPDGGRLLSVEARLVQEGITKASMRVTL